MDAPPVGPRAIPERPTLPPEVALTERTELYAVEGTTEGELTASFNENTPFRAEGGGARFFAYTAFDLDIAYSTLADARGCGIADLVVSLDLTVTLPVWTTASGATPEALRWFDDVRDALEVHEMGHARYNLHLAQALADALRPIRAGSCPEIRRTADTASGAIQAQYRAFHAEYDRATERGRRQRRDLFPDANR